MARFYCPIPLATGAQVELPAAAARHVQVLRMQPGHALTLFNGKGGEFSAEVQHMGRSDVSVLVGAHHAVEREASMQVHLAVGMPANERMDWLVEKATELGVQRITPLMTERSVVRLTGERAEKKQLHWQAVAISACEQCGRNQVPVIEAPQKLEAWLTEQAAFTSSKQVAYAVMSLHSSTQALSDMPINASTNKWVLLNGPEGGLSDAEDALARKLGFTPVSLGERVLRAETAAIGALSLLTLRA